MSREDQTLVTVTIEFPGLGNLGTWENRTNGKGGSDTTKHREGGMGPIKSFGGPQTIDNVQVARRFDPVRDAPLLKTLYRARGRARMIVTEQLLDEFSTAFGDVTTWTGKLAEVDPGNANANSGAIRMITLTQDTEDIS